MGQVDLSDYRSLYIESVRESIGNLRVQCDKLDNNALDKEAISNLHVASHSLKGRSQVMGYNDIAQLSKSLEEISNSALKGDVQLNSQIISGIRKSIEELEEILKRVQDDKKD